MKGYDVRACMELIECVCVYIYVYIYINMNEFTWNVFTIYSVCVELYRMLVVSHATWRALIFFPASVMASSPAKNVYIYLCMCAIVCVYCPICGCLSLTWLPFLPTDGCHYRTWENSICQILQIIGVLDYCFHTDMVKYFFLYNNWLCVIICYATLILIKVVADILSSWHEISAR